MKSFEGVPQFGNLDHIVAARQLAQGAREWRVDLESNGGGCAVTVLAVNRRDACSTALLTVPNRGDYWVKRALTMDALKAREARSAKP